MNGNIAKLFWIALALVLSGCGVNIHTNGRCPTPGVSPLASNCPSPEDMKTK